jgi:type II secretory pathway predicted ATPase ExeA
VSSWPPNPFVYDRPLPPDEIIDREGEIDLLLGLADAGQTARLSGPRRYGKTTLLRKLLAEADKRGLATVYVDLDRVVSLEGASERIEAAYRRQLQGPIRRTAANVIRTLRPRVGAGAGGVRGEIAPAIEDDARRVLERMLDLPLDIHKKHGKRTLVVFDEFQDVLRIGSEAEGLIRSHIQHQVVEAAYVFAGSHPGLMLALFSDRERPLFGQARPIQLGPLDDASLGDYIEARFQQTDRSAGEALDSLLALVRGHPQRAMLIAHHLWEATPRGETADLDTFATALEAVDRELREAFERTWERLRTNEARALAALAASEESLFHQRTLGHFGLSKSGAEQGRDKLIEYGEAQRLEDGRLVIVDPLLERWVRGTQTASPD